jgi:hypothetical protein
MAILALKQVITNNGQNMLHIFHFQFASFDAYLRNYAAAA